MIEWCKKVANHRVFQVFIIAVIVANAVLVAVETYYPHHEAAFDRFEYLILAIFVAEIAIRFMACAPDYLKFFKDGWNTFDFAIVSVSVVALVAGMQSGLHSEESHWGTELAELLTVVRLARMLRVVRLLSFHSEIRLIIDTMLRSLPSMVHVVLMLGVLLFVYGLIGHHLFKHIPYPDGWKPWETLHSSIWHMVHTITFENWVALQKPIVDTYSWGWLYFATFVVFGVFVALNMFIAVLMNSLEEAKEERAAEDRSADSYSDVLKRLDQVKANLAELEASLRSLQGQKVT